MILTYRGAAIHGFNSRLTRNSLRLALPPPCRLIAAARRSSTPCPGLSRSPPA